MPAMAAPPTPRKTPPKKKPTARKKAVGKAVPEKPAAQLGLTPKQQRFVDEYLIDLNASQAAIRAGYSPSTAGSIGHENLKKPEIQLALQEARKRQQERTQISADAVLRETWLQFSADRTELVSVHVGCCRHCYGEGFRYQRTLAEFNADRAKFLNGQRAGLIPAEEDFDEQGGIGYDARKPPREECPECMGAGQPRQVIKDTRNLSEAGRAIYAGARMGKSGLEVLLHNKDSAAERLFKHLGLYEKDNEQKTDPLTTLLQRITNANSNGFVPVQDDPESSATNGLLPKQDVEDDDDGHD